MGAIDKFLNAMKMNTEVDDDDYLDGYDDVGGTASSAIPTASTAAAASTAAPAMR